MTEILFLVIGVALVGAMAWAARRFWQIGGREPVQPEQLRRREDARTWQRRFTEDWVGGSNFHRPTQNEILETLHVLDHLTPGWDASATEIVEQRFLNELAVGCPSLRKDDCLFPVVVFEDLPVALRGTKISEAVVEAHLKNRRAEAMFSRRRLRAARTHATALAQAASESNLAETEPPDFALICADNGAGEKRRKRMAFWLLPIGLVVGGTTLAVGWLSRTSHLAPNFVETASVSPTSTPSPVADTIPIPLPATAASDTAPVVESSPAPEAKVAATATGTTAPGGAIALPTPGVPSLPGASISESLAEQISASKNRAVAKHPDLIVANSEINLRFVFRYKRLVEESSPRLRDPLWPEQLADESAAAAKAKVSQAAHPAR